MANITRTFTYSVPDDYTLQSNSLGLTAEYTYVGPEYIIAWADTNGFISNARAGTFDEWQANDWEKSGYILINANANPLEATILLGHLLVNHDDLPQKNITLPDGLVFSYPFPIVPWKAYEPEGMRWDRKTLSFATPYPWHKPWVSWSSVAQSASITIAECARRLDALNADESSDTDLIAAWEAFQTEAENKIRTYSDAGLLPHQVVWSKHPDYIETVYAEDSSE